MLPASLRVERGPGGAARRSATRRGRHWARAFRSRDRCRASGSPTVSPAPGWRGSRHSRKSNRWGEPRPSTRPGSAARVTLDQHDRRLLAALDRVGLAPIELLAMASPDDLTPRALAGRLARLHREGLIVRHRPRSPAGAALPPLYSITAEGMRAAQTQRPPAISTRRRWQSVEGDAPTEVVRRLRALAWTLALRRAAAGIATDNWRTSRYESGRYPVPRGAGRASRSPSTSSRCRPS